MPFTPPPQVPNWQPGNGSRLVTDRYDFEAHLEGTNPPYAINFRHSADQIDLQPLNSQHQPAGLLIDGYTVYTVQQAIQLLASIVTPPVIQSATIGNSAANLGIITLGGDLSGMGSTALSPRVSGLQGRPVSGIAPTSGQVLAWNGSAWTATSITVTTITMFGDVTGPSNASVVGKLQGTVALSGTPTGAGQALTSTGLGTTATWQPTNITLTGDATGSGNNVTGVLTTVGRLQGSVLLSGTPAAGQVLEATSPTAASWQYPTSYGEIYSNGNTSLSLGPTGSDGYNYTKISCLNSVNPNSLGTTPSGVNSNIVVANAGIYKATFNCQFKLLSEAAEILAFQFFVNGAGVGMVQSQSAFQIDLMSSFGIPYANTDITFSPTQSFTGYIPAGVLIPAGLYFNFSMSHIISVPAGGTVDVRVSTGEGLDQFYMYGSMCLVSL